MKLERLRRKKSKKFALMFLFAAVFAFLSELGFSAYAVSEKNISAASVLIPLIRIGSTSEHRAAFIRRAARQGHFLRRHAFQSGGLLVRHLPRLANGFHRAKLVVEPHRRAVAGRHCRTFQPAQSATHSLRHVQSARPVFVRSGRRNLSGRNFLGWPHAGHRNAGANAILGSKRNGQHADRPVSAARGRLFSFAGAENFQAGLTHNFLKQFLAATFSKIPPTNKFTI
jgi:hypothetical protein